MTEETNQNGQPMCSGLFLDATHYNDDILIDVLNGKQNAVVEALKRLKKDKDFNPPYMTMDLATLDDIGIIIDGEKYDAEKNKGAFPVSTEAAKNPALKLVMSAVDIVDIKSIMNTTGGNSVVKCNPAVPVYRWFQAANLMLKYCDQKGRVIPFPISQQPEEGKEDEEVMVTFHMLRVDPREFIEYQRFLDHCVSQDGIERGFEIAAKYSYEVLSNRGIKELTAEQVDSTLTHVILKQDARLRGVLLHNYGRDDLEDETLQESHFVYY